MHALARTLFSFLPALLLAGQAFAAPPRPGPSGVVKAGSSRVVAYDGAWQGEPAGQPLDRVRGTFEVEGYRYPEPARWSSLFFLRARHYPVHRALLGGEERERAALGLIVHRKLPAGSGALAGVVIEVDSQEPAAQILRYLPARLRVRDEQGHTRERVVAQGQAFRLALPPGRYWVESTATPSSPALEVEVHAGRTSLALLRRRPLEPGLRSSSVPGRERPRALFPRPGWVALLPPRARR